MATKPVKGKNTKEGKKGSKNASAKKQTDSEKKPRSKTDKKQETKALPEQEVKEAPAKLRFKPEGLLENYPEVKIIIALLVCILLMLCNFHMCGAIGTAIYSLLHGLFGWLAYILPVFWFIAYTFLVANSGRYKSVAQSKILFADLLVWNMTGFAHLIGVSTKTAYNPVLYYKNGQSDFNGGMFGGLLAGGLQHVIGDAGAWIFLLAMFAILVIFITERKATMLVAHEIQLVKSFFDGGSEIEADTVPAVENQEKEDVSSAYEEVSYEDVAESGALASKDNNRLSGPEEILQVPADYPGSKKEPARSKFIFGKLPFSKDKKDEKADKADSAIVEDTKRSRYQERGPVVEKNPYVNGMNGNQMKRQKLLLDRDLLTLEAMGFESQIFAQASKNADTTVSIDDFILYNSIQEWDDSTPYVMPDPLEPEGYEDDSVLISADDWQSDRSGEIIGADFWQSDIEEKGEELQILNPWEEEIEDTPQEDLKYVFPVEALKSKEDDADSYDSVFVYEEPDGSKEMEDAVDLTEHVELPESFISASPKKGKSVQDINIWKDKDSRGSRSDSGSVTFTEPIKEKPKPEVIKKPYVAPPINKLKAQGVFKLSIGNSHREIQQKLAHTLESFGVKVKMGAISVGPAVTRYELEPEVGVKVSRIVSLQDDIKLALAAADVRIEAPIPGKSAVGIEVPNKENTIVGFRELIDTEKFKNHPSKLCVAIGRDLAGQVQVADLAKMPHLLIAGATGSGKSVCINTLIMSILYKANPDEVKLIMVDPKVVELSAYNGIPHLLIPVVTDPRKASNALRWAVDEMDARYNKLAQYKVRNIQGYNEEVKKRKALDPTLEDEPMYQMVIIVDELADLMMVAPGEVEEAICRLAQKARAAGIHLVLATQRPSVNVITGLIKANVPSRIAFAVSSGVDSRTILDMNGAEKLLGKGDMLYYPYGLQKPIRVQGAFISDEEVSAVVEYIVKHNSEKSGEERMVEMITSASETKQVTSDQDEYFADAARFIIEKDKASIGALQRQFKIGFNRAARLMDALADVGIVGEEEGTKPRKILMNLEELEAFLKNM